MPPSGGCRFGPIRGEGHDGRILGGFRHFDAGWKILAEVVPKNRAFHSVFSLSLDRLLTLLLVFWVRRGTTIRTGWTTSECRTLALPSSTALASEKASGATFLITLPAPLISAFSLCFFLSGFWLRGSCRVKKIGRLLGHSFVPPIIM